MSLEENFNKALNLSTKNYTNSELLDMLSFGDIAEKQIAALLLKEINSSDDAKILVNNLTGQDGKIREAVAFKINELFLDKKFRPFFDDEIIYSTLFDGIMDINGNVCRLIVELTLDDIFSSYLAKKLPQKISEILVKISNLTDEEKKYVISKRNFQLYWSLEALYYCVEKINENDILGILAETSKFDDYTIREKTAKILSQINSTEFDELKKILKNDENYYVRIIL